MDKLDRGAQLAIALKVKKVSQSELAEKMGISRQLVNKWVKTGGFSFEKLSEILSVLEMEFFEFWKLNGEDFK